MDLERQEYRVTSPEYEIHVRTFLESLSVEMKTRIIVKELMTSSGLRPFRSKAIIEGPWMAEKNCHCSSGYLALPTAGVPDIALVWPGNVL